VSDSEGGDLKSIVKAGAEVVTELAKADQEQQKTFQAAIDLVRRAGRYRPANLVEWAGRKSIEPHELNRTVLASDPKTACHEL